MPPSTTQPVVRALQPSTLQTVASIVVLALAIFVTISFEMLPIGLLGSIAEGVGSSEQGTGFLMSVYALMVVVLAIPLAAYTARFDARRLLAFTLMVFAVSAAMMVLAPSLPVAVAARLIAGVAHAVIFTVVFRIALAVVSAGRKSVAAGAVSGANATALSLGVPAATGLGVAASWQMPFLVLAIAFIVLSLLVLVVIPRAASAAEGTLSAHDVKRAMRQPALLKVGVTTIITMTAQFTSYTYVEPLLRERGVPEQYVSIVLLGYGVSGVLGLFAVLRLSDRSPSATFRFAVGLVAFSLVGLLLSGRSTASTIAFVLIWGLTFGALPLLVQVLALRGAGALPSAGAPVNNSSFNVGIAAGSAVGGALLALTSLTVVLIFSSVLMFAIFAITLIRGWLPSDRVNDCNDNRD